MTNTTHLIIKNCMLKNLILLYLHPNDSRSTKIILYTMKWKNLVNITNVLLVCPWSPVIKGSPFRFSALTWDFSLEDFHSTVCMDCLDLRFSVLWPCSVLYYLCPCILLTIGHIRPTNCVLATIHVTQKFQTPSKAMSNWYVAC